MGNDERQANSPTSPLDTVLPGEPSTGRLSDYDVVKPVGKGGYSVVYKGTRKKDDRIVAIKKIEIFDMAPKKRERCLQEVQLLQTCKHPNIIQMLDAFIDDNMLVIVFEWAPAGDLKRLIKKTAENGKQLEESLIWNYFFQIADAVRYMHKNRVMHRDIKPANVLVGANGALKLGDLGLGRHFSEHTNEVFSKVGTPYYVSPEVVKGVGYDWKSDVWSLGCLLYELAVLKSPFETEGANLYDVFQKINAGDYKPLPDDRHSKVYRNLVESMLRTNPDERPSMEKVWQITRGVFDHQHHVSRSTHLMSEQATDKLTLLAVELRRQAAARQLIGGPPPEDSKIMLAPPDHIFSDIHPLFFAESLGPKPKRSSSKNSKHSAPALEGTSYQFAVLLTIVLWLFQLNGKSQEAEELEKELALVAGGSSRNRPRKDLVIDDESRVGIADRIRVVVTGMGLEADFATTQEIAHGFGRTVCLLLDSLAEKSIKGLGIRARKPVREDEPAVAADGFEEIMEDLELPEDEVITAASIMAAAEEADGPGSKVPLATQRSADMDMERCVIESSIDPDVWRAEADRLGRQLNRITVKAESSGRFGSWEVRLLKLQKAQDEFAKACPDAQSRGEAWQQDVSKDMEALNQREHFINHQFSQSAAEYAAARERLVSAIKRRDEAEEQVSSATSHLADLEKELAQTSEAIEERQNDFDGARPMARLKDALRTLEGEVKDMEQQLEISRSQLLSKQKAFALEMVRAGHSSTRRTA